MSGRNNVNERPNRNTFNNRGDNGLYFHYLTYLIKQMFLNINI